jgi:hypothetical protein
MAQQGDPDPSVGQLNPIVEHSGVELAPAGDGSAADQGADDQETPDAAAAFKAAAMDAAGGKASSWFEYELPDLVNTPGGLQTIASLFVFFLQKLSLQLHVGVEWPSWFLNFLDILGFLCFEVPAFGFGVGLVVPEECLFTARLLVSVALLIRMAYVLATIPRAEKNWGAARYGSVAEVVRTVVLGIAAPTLLSALAIAIGAPTGTNWLTGLGVVLCWPIIVYLVLVHVARILIWKSCCSKCVKRVIMCIRHSNKKSNRKLINALSPAPGTERTRLSRSIGKRLV